MIGVTENLKLISDLLNNAVRAAGRPPGSVRLLAVSKRQPVASIREAVAAGQRDFGENYVQEGLDKIAAVADPDLRWHFIGHLQSNKTRAVAEHFDWVHTIDSPRVARRLSAQRPASMAPLNVCLQVNIDGEASKAGVAPDDVADLAAACADLPGIRLRGLMCLPAVRPPGDAQREPFAALRRLQAALCNDGLALDTLSMGMSGDFEAAIAEGATIVRIGTAVFGPRDD